MIAGLHLNSMPRVDLAARVRIDDQESINADLHFIHVLEGSLLLTVGPARARLDRDTVGFIPPFTPYRLTKSRGASLTMINPHVGVGMDGDPQSEQRLLPPIQFKPARLPRIHRLLKAARRSIDAPGSPGQRLWLSSRVLTTIAGYLCRHGVPGPNAEAPMRMVDRVAAGLRSQTHQKFELNALAEQWNTSPSHLNRCFRRAFGQTPFQFWQACRVKHVQAALVTSDTKLEELAAAFEFADASHLSKWFKARTGTTISSYRQATGLAL